MGLQSLVQRFMTSMQFLKNVVTVIIIRADDVLILFFVNVISKGCKITIICWYQPYCLYLITANLYNQEKL